MTFFQNPFTPDFQGNLILGDRHHIPGFPIKGNAGRGDNLVMNWNNGPFDLSDNDADGTDISNLILWVAIDTEDFNNWSQLSIDLGTGATETVFSIRDTLNADTVFSAWFTSTVANGNNSESDRLIITQKRPITQMRFYVGNGAAEEALGFNARAGVGEILTYFDRDKVAHLITSDGGDDTAAIQRERYKGTGSRPTCNCLVPLDPGSPGVDANIIDNAVNAKGVSLALDSSTIKEDWEIMAGKSGSFQFTKISAAVKDHTITSIIYPAGAVIGDFALEIVEEYDASDVLLRKFEKPHTLVAADLITPS